VFGITDVTTYIIGTILIIILPGPNSLYVMSIASRFGIKAGYQGAWGVFTGDLIALRARGVGHEKSPPESFRAASTLEIPSALDTRSITSP